MYGYKAFNKDLKCRNFQYEIGKTYSIDGKLEICNNGFHFCKLLDNEFNYYGEYSRVCLVRGVGPYIEDGDKVCFANIEIIRELTEEEIKNGLNKNNSGNYNSGNYNSGNYNSGYCNSGNRNSGFFNTNSPKIRMFTQNQY